MTDTINAITMKHIIRLLALLGPLLVAAQTTDPVTWTFEAQASGNQTYALSFHAELEEGWFIYSQHIEDGPIPTAFHFEEDSSAEVLGAIDEQSEHRKEGFDELFGANVIKYSEAVTFLATVRVADPTRPVEGYFEYMVCNDEMCLPPAEKDFRFPLADQAKPSAPATAGSQGPASDTFREAQSPVSWTGRLQRAAPGTYTLTLEAKIDQGWYTYSQFLEEDGPIATGIYFDEQEGLERKGTARESGAVKVEEYDTNFEMELVKFKQSAIFEQSFQLNDAATPVTGYLEYMVCNDTQCLPPAQVPFHIDPAGLSATLGETPDELGASLESEAAAGELFQLQRPDLDAPAAACGEVETVAANASYWRIFALGFAGGLLALLTPCVFPMIPLTVSFFTKSSEDRSKGVRNAALYGFFILLVYLLLSVPFHLMEGISSGILNDISTNVYLNVFFFLIFLFFAFSFFGYYELTLPASWTNKASSAEGIGGAIGIFFMALTLALVSFSCTGPILGSLLAGAMTATGGAWQLTMGMAGFGLALALPFALFAAFPGWMNSLPRSGGWLNTVKVTLGFLELALALKFLSNADLVEHWGILKIELFLGLWILIFLGLALYLFGLIRFPHDSPVQELSTGRKMLGGLSFAFVLYLATGFLYDEQADSYRSLKLLSGLAPPAGYSYVYPSDCPVNLNCFKDLNEGLAYAREQNKPVMIDFTGYACVNCRKMEEHVWPEGEVYRQLKDDYVLISLYVDDKKELPADQQVKVEDLYGSRSDRLETYGQKWQYFQQQYFGALAQPFYVLISPGGQLLNNPVGYTPDVEEYADFLECGRNAYRELVEEGNPKAPEKLSEELR